MKSWIIGFNRTSGELYSYNTLEQASIECEIWRVVEAETCKEAKDIVREMYQVDNEQ